MTAKTETCAGCRQKANVIRELIDSVEDLKRRIAGMSPHLLDEERTRARAVWEAAKFAYDNGQPGDPGPIAVVASALYDAEKRGAAAVASNEAPLEDEDGQDELDEG